jgi:lipopolysaccharide/colanic/teichoic acid biosynthesis glycosyltransferase
MRTRGLARVPAGSLPLHLSVDQDRISRVVQVVLSAVGLVVLSPLLLLIALAIRVTSRGPIFYRGQRVGKNERIFTIYKFRTLTVDAEKKIGQRLLTEHDPVYTPIGKLLKKTKLDEIPQLLNVLRGDMSLVGPRPVRPIFLEAFKRQIPNYALRFAVRPGMTGLAQVRGGYWTEPHNKIRYELVYISTRSLLLDLKLIWLTFLKILSRFVTTGVALSVLFLFVSFLPTGYYPWLYAYVLGLKVNVLYLLILLFGVWVAVRNTYAHRLFIYRSSVYLPMVAFAAVGFASAVLAEDRETAFRGTLYYVVTGFFVAFGLLNTKLSAGVARSAATLVGLACGLLSLVSLFELALMKYAVMGPGLEGASGAWPIRATFASASVLSAYLVLGFPLMLCALIHARSRDGRDFWLVATTVAFTSILLTQSFLGLVALFVACTVFLAFVSPRAVPLTMALFLVPALVLGGIHEAAAPSRAVQFVTAKLSREMKVLASVPPARLLLGYGPKTLRQPAPETPAEGAGAGPAAAPATAELARAAAGNMHLAHILETGILGWLLMMWIFYATLRSTFRGARLASDPYLRSLVWAVFASVVGFLISMSGFDVFSHIPLQVLFWGLVGLGLGVCTHVNGRRTSFYTIWRFGDDRPRASAARARADAGPGDGARLPDSRSNHPAEVRAGRG